MLLLAISAIVAVVMAALLFRLFFKDFADFVECLRFYFQPDFISLFRGELLKDWWGSTKFAVWVAIPLIMGLLTFCKLAQWFPSLRGHNISQVSAREQADEPEEPDTTATNEPGNASVQSSARSSIGTNLIASTQIQTNVLRQAARHDVKVGDIVAISALKPAISLRRATITDMNDEQVTVSNGGDRFTVQWKNVIKLQNAVARN